MKMNPPQKFQRTYTVNGVCKCCEYPWLYVAGICGAYLYPMVTGITLYLQRTWICASCVRPRWTSSSSRVATPPCAANVPRGQRGVPPARYARVLETCQSRFEVACETSFHVSVRHCIVSSKHPWVNVINEPKIKIRGVNSGAYMYVYVLERC